MHVSNTTSAANRDALNTFEIFSHINGLMPWSFDFHKSYLCQGTQSVAAFVRESVFGFVGFSQCPRHLSSFTAKHMFLFQVALQSGPDAFCYGGSLMEKAIMLAANTLFVAIRSILMFPGLFVPFEEDFFFRPTLV